MNKSPSGIIAICLTRRRNCALLLRHYRQQSNADPSHRYLRAGLPALTAGSLASVNANVLWSLADILRCYHHVRFTPESGHVQCKRGCPLWAKSGHGARVKRSCWLQAYAYLEVVSGSIPLFVIASEARAEARNSISRLEPSMLPEPATTAAENV
jgi:hypothetical protein